MKIDFSPHCNEAAPSTITTKDQTHKQSVDPMTVGSLPVCHFSMIYTRDQDKVTFPMLYILDNFLLFITVKR